MVAWLNQNQGVLGFVSIVIAIVGFFITNKNIKTTKVSQKTTNGSKSIQSGRDAVDKSINTKE